MAPRLEDIRKVNRRRGSFMRRAESGLMDLAKAMQRKLNSFVLKTFVPSLDIRNNQLVNNAKNLRKVNAASSIKRFMKNVVNANMFKYYNQKFSTVEKISLEYYNPFEPSPTLEKNIMGRAQIEKEGFFNDLFDNNDILKKMQNSLRNGVITEQITNELNSVLTKQIEGTPDKLGIVASYHYQNGYDEFQSYSRSIDEQFSKQLNLNYAFYAGGVISDTRDFCRRRSGKLFNRETIESWNYVPANWSGRKENNNILIDMGGWNCRHDFDWISWELAKRVNPDIQRSKYDNV